jgi:hypothetical protein
MINNSKKLEIQRIILIEFFFIPNRSNITQMDREKKGRLTEHNDFRFISLGNGFNEQKYTYIRFKY